jgi:enoyl-CoA hydratase
VDYSAFQGLDIDVHDDGVALVRMKFKGDEPPDPDAQSSEPRPSNWGPIRRHQHRELTTVWRVLDDDPDVRAALITGPEGSDFYVSGKPPGVQLQGEDLWKFVVWADREVNELITAMAAFGKPLVGAISGAAAGAGLATALLTDISIVSESAILFDPHMLMGMAAGDGACALWPFYTGMPKAKLYMLTSDGLTGREADRIGLVSRAVADNKVMDVAWDYARRLAAGPPNALRFTKKSMNQWFKLTSLVSQELSMATQLLAEFSGDRAGSPYSEFPPRIIP